MTIYVIAENFLVIENGESVEETRVCHNLGAFSKELDANLKCLEMNVRGIPDDDSGDSNYDGDRYFVLSIELK